MIVKGKVDTSQRGRVVYPLGGRELAVGHFVVRLTTPENPFEPHRHEKEEMWFILEGRGTFVDDAGARPVESGDLITIESGALHGLRTDGEVRWICMG